MGSIVKKLAVLGSTGSIGQQTLDIVRALPQKFQIVGLAAWKNFDLLADQIDEFKPQFVCYQDKENHSSYTRCRFISLDEIASLPDTDMVVIATSGKAGLSPLLSAIRAGKTIALANKESLVMAGEIVSREAMVNNARILPVDSEHSAIWQCLNGEAQKPDKLILTASGGPFRGYTRTRLEKVTVEQALNHPSWKMGKKVTIDSATLMNKGLEVIEAHWLFDMPYDSITVLVHPQSVVHSMVEFADGTVKAQLSHPDMRLPIQYALSYPERLPNPTLRRIDWNILQSLTFEQPDFDTFSCLKLAIEAGKKGGTYPAVLCAADEVAVECFLAQRIKFIDIPELIEQTLQEHQNIAHPGIKQIMTADIWARQKALQLSGAKC